MRKAIEDADGKPGVHVSTSAEGRIFILNAAGRIWSADGRLLQLNHAKQCVARCLTTASRSKEPGCTFTAHGLTVSSGGDFILIHGSVHVVRSLSTCSQQWHCKAGHGLKHIPLRAGSR